MSYSIRSVVVGSFVLTLCTACGGGGGESGTSSHVSNAAWDGCPSLPASTQSAGSLGALVDNAVLAEMTAQGNPGMSIAIAKNGAIIYAAGYGYSDLSTCTPMPTNAEMQIGSVTKQFTAAAVLQLQQSGVLNIDQALVSILPNYAFDPRITVRMLLNQTSGLQDYLSFPQLQQYANSGAPESVALNAILQTPLLFPPGTAYNYSNSNYFVLGSVIEAVTGQTYPDYLAANIFSAARLSNTFYTRPSPSAAPYVPGATGPVAGKIPDPSAYFAAGALWSNVQDLATWDSALFSGQVIPSSLFNLMVTPPPVAYFQQVATPSDYGMGWIRGGTPAGHPFIWHNGQTVSYTSFNGMFLDDGFSIVVLTNYPVQENTPLLNFAEGLIQTICSNATTAATC